MFCSNTLFGFNPVFSRRPDDHNRAIPFHYCCAANPASPLHLCAAPAANADYRVGGKLGPPAPAPHSASAACDQGVDADAIPQEQGLEDMDDPKFAQDRAAASRVLSDAVKGKEGGEGGGDGGAIGSRLSSSFWAELLD